jgi:CPA2 family monovalent cation:H+ antiporter-2
MTPFMIRASDRVGRFVDAHLPQSVGVLQSIYDRWTEQVRARPHPREYRGDIAFIGLAMGAVAAVAIVYAVFANRLQMIVVVATGFSPGTAAILVRATALGLVAVPGVAIWRGAHRLAHRIAASISAASAPPDQATDADLTRSNLLSGIFEIAIVFGAVTLLLAIVGPFMSVLDGVALMLIAMAGLAIVILRSARQLYALARASAGNTPATSDGIGPFIHLPIPEGSAAVGRSLSDLNLHAATGAMVMAIVRDGHSVILPGGSEVLRAGDTIALAGSSDAIAAAHDLLAPPVHSASAPQPTNQ